jgi:pilus assembly protein CpaE
MRIMVAGDNGPLAARIREDLKGTTLISADLQVLSLEEAVDRVVQFRPEVVVLTLSPSPEQALAALREIRAMLPAHVLAVGPATDPRLILRTLREGACQYLDEIESIDEVAVVLKRLSFESPQQLVQGRLITVLGPSGGNGASTVAANVAAVLARKYERCALFDLKLETGDLATLLNVEPKHTLADFCRNMERMDQVMFEQCFAVHSTGVRLLAPPARYAEVDDVTPRGVRKALSMARSLFPFVVVDLDHSYRSVHAQALYQAEVVLLVMQFDFTSLRQTRRVLNYLEEVGVGRNRIQLVANRYRRPKELGVGEVEDALGMEVRHFIPDDPKNVNFANNKGVPVVLERPRAKSARIMTQIAASVNGRLTQ